jgi:hypothetical protein
MVINGPRGEPEFYNSWRAQGHGRVMPMLLGEMIYVAGTNAVSLVAESATIDAVRAVAVNSDLGSTMMSRYWRAVEDEGLPRVSMRLSNDDAFIAERDFGLGNIVQVFAGLDESCGNLTKRMGFLPMVHELVYYLARPYAVNLNQAPALGLTIMLTGGQGGDSGADGGLRGE